MSWEDSLEKRTATHSSILAWRFPWMEKPGRGATNGLHVVIELANLLKLLDFWIIQCVERNLLMQIVGKLRIFCFPLRKALLFPSAPWLGLELQDG